MSSTFNKEPKM